MTTSTQDANVDIPNDGDMRIWYLHQVGIGGKRFLKKVDSVKQAAEELSSIYALALFLEEENFIPDYCNMGGLEVWKKNEDGEFEWCEYTDDEGCDISEHLNKHDD